jgi:predicted nucleotidyltransferase
VTINASGIEDIPRRHGGTMRREDVLERLRVHREELRTRFAVGSIALFGSYARDEAGPDSDVNLLVEFERTPTFLGYMELVDFLEQLFGARVDLATPNKLKPRARPYVERELIRVA